jgi:hypothetical protein
MFAVLLPASVAAAQQAAQLERFERQLERAQSDTRVRVDQDIPPEDRALIDYGGFLSLSYLNIDDSIGHNHQLGQYELVGYGRVNIDGVHELFVRGNANYLDFKDGDSFDGRGDDLIGPRIERAHYRFDLQRALAAYNGQVIDWNVVVQGGRDLVVWANGLTFNEVIDGGTVRATYGPAALDVVAGVTWNKDVDFDISRPDFRQDTDRGFYGGMLSVQSGLHTPFVYGLVQRDYNGNEVSNRGGVTTRFDYNSYYLGAGSTGSFTDNWLYGLEVVYEGGGGLSNSIDNTGAQVTQTHEDIQAWALDARLDYLFADVRRSRVELELILASGDTDRQTSNGTLGGNQPGTDDHGFNAFGLLNTGLAFAPAVSNLIVTRLGASCFPWPDTSRFRQLQLGADVLVFNKFLEDAPIDEPTNDHRFLGVEGDLYLTWQVASDVTFSLRYGGFIPGPSIEGDSSLRSFFFAGVTYAF